MKGGGGSKMFNILSSDPPVNGVHCAIMSNRDQRL